MSAFAGADFLEAKGTIKCYLNECAIMWHFNGHMHAGFLNSLALKYLSTAKSDDFRFCMHSFCDSFYTQVYALVRSQQMLAAVDHSYAEDGTQEGSDEASAAQQKTSLDSEDDVAKVQQQYSDEEDDDELEKEHLVFDEEEVSSNAGDMPYLSDLDASFLEEEDTINYFSDHLIECVVQWKETGTILLSTICSEIDPQDTIMILDMLSAVKDRIHPLDIHVECSVSSTTLLPEYSPFTSAEKFDSKSFKELKLPDSGATQVQQSGHAYNLRGKSKTMVPMFSSSTAEHPYQKKPLYSPIVTNASPPLSLETFTPDTQASTATFSQGSERRPRGGSMMSVVDNEDSQEEEVVHRKGFAKRKME